MTVSDFMLHPEHEITLIVYRDVFIDEASLKGKFSKDFETLSVIVKLDEKDIKKFGLKEGGNAKISSSSSSIIAKVVKDTKPHEGYAFMPLSPWSNALMQYDGKNYATMRQAKVKISYITLPVTEIKELL